MWALYCKLTSAVNMLVDARYMFVGAVGAFLCVYSKDA